MATTTNYGWTTPDDTDLVKDGAAAIRTLGSSIDTTTKNLNPETTTGDIAYRSATANVNTRLALGTAGQVLKVNAGATAPEWATDASGMTNPMTTTGDVIYSSSGSTPARLGIGTAGQVLQVNSGATAPEWAAPAGGGMTLLSTTSLSGSTTTISGISGSYVDLVIYVTDWDPTVDGSAAYLRLNGETGNVYSQAATVAGSTTPTLTDKFTLLDTSIDDTALDGLFWIQIPYYANTATFKISQMYSIAQDNTTAPRLRMHNNFGAVNTTSAISSITLFPSSGNATGTAYIYGVK